MWIHKSNFHRYANIIIYEIDIRNNVFSESWDEFQYLDIFIKKYQKLL